MQSGGGDREACRVKASPAVKACVQKAMTAAPGRPKAPVAIPAETQKEPQEKTAPQEAAPLKLAPQKPPVFVAPPRTIDNITAFLDQEKPGGAKRAKTEADAEAEPPAGGSRSILKDFYSRRCRARAALGRFAGVIADCERAIAHSDDYVNDGSRIEQFLETQMRLSGDYKGAIAALERMARKLDVANKNKGRAFQINMAMALNLVYLAEIDRAKAYVSKSQALLSEARSWPNGQPYLSNWEASLELAKAMILGSRGRYDEAELAFHRAGALYRDASAKCPSWPIRTPCDYDSTIYYMAVFEAGAKSSQGRLAEAEIDIRRALLSHLRTVGKYHPDIANGLITFSQILTWQARFAEAETIARAAIEIFRSVGFSEDSRPYINALERLTRAVFNLGRYAEVKEIFLAMDRATASWSPERSAYIRLNWQRINTHYFTGEVEKGIELARENLTRSKTSVGEQHYNTAMTRAMLATGLTFARRDAEALREFSEAVPLVLAANPNEDVEDTLTTTADRRLRSNLEANIAVLARSSLSNRAEESLRLADAIRSRAVRNALAAAAARAGARTPALAELARKEQDLDKQIQAQTALISNVLAQPPEQRQGTILKDLQQELDRLRAQRKTARQDIAHRFPEYTNLLSPAPATAEDIRAVLRPDEALVSFYFGFRGSFVWAMTKTGPVALAALPLTAKQLENKVQALRVALEPSVSLIGDIPAFDVAAAHELYRLLLAPVEATWRPAKSLIVVTNGALGQLPISLLPTEPVDGNDKAPGESLFAWYRRIPWLARTHAVVSLPSASALRTLRRAAAPTAKRASFVGFGDPFFNAEQAAEAAAAELKPTTAADDTRGARIKLRASVRLDPTRNAGLGMLPRLPDTADELIAIAASLQADPTKSLHLGKAANEKVVTSLDLAQYRVVAFATHGLVPGDLDGLTQPALALTAPGVAGIDGDGLLTTEEILQLKLDADWVVLSACNTAAGADVEAEAISGLGRAFFYAGSRALLVTNWPVHSESARDLVTDVFRRQAANSSLTRAEALRQAMMALLDGGEARDGTGRTLFTYGHPLFWAPYALIGDGGGQ